jgi:ubiquinone/menaquinone biosynthesis C-methylase UbiE
MYKKNLSILFLCVLLYSCLDSQGSGKRYPIEQTHGHHHNHEDHEDHDHETSYESPLGVNNPIKGMSTGKQDAFSSDNRDLWQRPDLIIYHLGNLEGKTMADVGAGPVGYFSFIVAANTNVKKVLALDIDEDAIAFMDEMKIKTKNLLGDKIETRLVKPEDPLLIDKEVEVILISSTLTYIKNKIAYLKDLRNKMPVGGRLVIVDYKMKEIPDFFPTRDQRIPLYEMEDLIDKAGFKRIVTDDTTLKYQYIVVALNP